MAKVAFLGLGVMGGPMARHLKVKGGHDVVVFNRTLARAEAWVAANGGSLALTPAEAEALPRLGEAAALRFTLTRLHDRIFHDPSKLVTPKDPAVFLRRLDGWRALEAVA